MTGNDKKTLVKLQRLYSIYVIQYSNNNNNILDNNHLYIWCESVNLITSNVGTIIDINTLQRTVIDK